MRHWLVKSEPGAYSIHDLEAEGRTHWDGVRNYEARNHMRDMACGDRVLFYHSNADPPGAAGTATVVREAYADFTAFDPSDPHFDPRSKPEAPRWDMVDLAHERTFEALVPLSVLREDPLLVGMPLLQKGQRLSVQPVERQQFERIVDRAR